jgi:hypothetical protein
LINPFRIYENGIRFKELKDMGKRHKKSSLGKAAFS